MAKRHKIIRLSFDTDRGEKIEVVFSTTTNKGEILHPSWMTGEDALVKIKNTCFVLLETDIYGASNFSQTVSQPLRNKRKI